ncbi:MAG: hypothetical protein ACM3S2_11210 [Ignavibacteriales bacterium]
MGVYLNKIRLLNWVILSSIFILSSFFFYSCARTGSVMYPKADFPLTKDIAYSLTSDMTVRIPKGWFASEDNECKCIDLWLIRNDFSATLNFVALNRDSISQRIAGDDSLLAAFEYSRDLKKNKLGERYKSANKDEIFELNEQRFASYEYTGDEGLPVRVIVFRYKDRYFELSAMPAQQIGRGKVEPEELFRVQQAILTTINF